MSSCPICLDLLNSPVALPCGHVFCHQCIASIVQMVRPFTIQHPCPSCRRPFTILSIDSSLIPPQLRVHVTPPIRKLYLDQPASPTEPEPGGSASGTNNDGVITRLKAENVALRRHCSAWRTRAEVHGNVTLGLVGLAKMAKNQAARMQNERDELQTRYDNLKRMLDDPGTTSPVSPPSPDDYSPPPQKRKRLTTPKLTATARQPHNRTPVDGYSWAPL